MTAFHWTTVAVWAAAATGASAQDAKIEALTAEQINGVFRRLLDPEALSIVKAGDFEKAGVYHSEPR